MLVVEVSKECTCVETQWYIEKKTKKEGIFKTERRDRLREA